MEDTAELELPEDIPAPPTETVQDLLEDLSQVKDFPALSHIITQVNRISTSENSRTDDLTDTILKDVSLTNKLLRIVNAAHFGQFGGKTINTISRAIVILGYDTIRDAALSLMLFEHLNNHAQAAELKAEAIESFYCGLIGRSLAQKSAVKDSEEVMISALFRNVGRMMCRLHFYERAHEVEDLVANARMSEEAASRKVFGVTYDEFGLALAQHWHLPPTLVQGMTPLPDGPLKAPGNEAAKVQMLSNMAHDLYVTTKGAPPEDLQKAITDLSKRFNAAVNIHPEVLVDLVYESSQAMEKEAQVLQVDVRSSPMLKRLLEGKDTPQEAADAAKAEEPDDALHEIADLTPENDPTAILITGLQDLTSMMLGDFKPADLLHVAAELLYRSQCFDHVLICSIAPSGKELVGRIGFGANAERMKRAMRISITFAADVFHAAVSKNVDLMISDTRADNIKTRIPPWFHEHAGAKSFLLLPIVLNNRTVALLYGDRQTESLALSQQTLGLIKSLRNQIALALRQRTH